MDIIKILTFGSLPCGPFILVCNGPSMLVYLDRCHYLRGHYILAQKALEYSDANIAELIA